MQGWQASAGTAVDKLSRRQVLRLAGVSAAGLALSASGACAARGGPSEDKGTLQNYPIRPITLLVPVGTGGGSDQFTRALARACEKITDHQFVVQNMPGGSGNVAQNYVMGQPADGYIVYQTTAETRIRTLRGLSAVTVDDIVPVAKSPETVDMWFIRPNDKRFGTFDELVRYAKKNPNKGLSFGVVYLNGYDDAYIHAVTQKMGLRNISLVPFSEPSERYAALLGGKVDVVFEQVGDVISFVRSSKFKPILVYAEKPVRGFETVPTTYSNGIKLDSAFWRGLFVRKGTSMGRVDYLSGLFLDAMQSEHFRREYTRPRLYDLGTGPMGDADFRGLLEKSDSFFRRVYSRS